MVTLQSYEIAIMCVWSVMWTEAKLLPLKVLEVGNWMSKQYEFG